jgi:hypothetical protein
MMRSAREPLSRESPSRIFSAHDLATPICEAILAKRTTKIVPRWKLNYREV